ncbi:MAG: RidA family protein, partial [Planctomycetota bacterium]
MTTQDALRAPPAMRPRSADERAEMQALGLLDDHGRPRPLPLAEVPERNGHGVSRSAISNDDVLNEAFDYAKPSSFTRGLNIELKANTRLLLISGTASIDDHGETVYVGDFRAQCWRTFRNITELLRAEGATWHD